jgi:hypothetical protein
MKKLIIAFFMLFLVNFCFAESDSGYEPDNRTITISSHTYTKVSYSYGYRELYVGDPDTVTPIFYTIDGDSQTVTTNGWWIPEGMGQSIEFNGDVYFQLGAGESPVTVRKMEFRR